MKIQRFDKTPEGSIILKNINGEIHYTDSFRIDIVNNENHSIDYLAAIIFSYLPGWVELLLKLRDFIVKPFGLKTGIINEKKEVDKSIRYNCGEMLIFFPVIDRTESEIVMAEDDKHLYFRVSVLIKNNSHSGNKSVYVTTIVQFHNILGRIYFMPVKPFHRFILRSYLSHFLKQKKIY